MVDDYNREGFGIELDFSLPSLRVIRSLNQIIEWRGRTKQIRGDNGPEYINELLRNRAEQMDIKISFIQPGNPQQSARDTILIEFYQYLYHKHFYRCVKEFVTRLRRVYDFVDSWNGKST